MSFNSYTIAESLIEDIFLIQYCPTIQENKTWFYNINLFLLEESNRIQLINNHILHQFTRRQEHDILEDSLKILLQVLTINDREWEIHEEDVCWDKFDDILKYYMCLHKSNKNNSFIPLTYNYSSSRMAAGGG